MNRLWGRLFWRRGGDPAFGSALARDPALQALNEAELQEIDDHLPDLTGYRVLDLGAGIGRFTGRLAERAERVLALDLSADAIAENRQRHAARHNIDYRVADAVAEDLGAAQYDLVFSNWLFMYLDDADARQVLTHVLRALKPGGWLFLRESCRLEAAAGSPWWRWPAVPRLALQHVPVPWWQRWRYLLPGQRRIQLHRRPEQYERLLQQVGFEPEAQGRLGSYEAAFDSAHQQYWLLRKPIAQAGTDAVGDGLFAPPRAWTFGGETWRSFDDHIRRSIPFYDALHELIAGLAVDFARPEGWLLELGCSTGTLSARLSQACPDSRVCGVDAEPTMIAAAQRQLRPNLEYHCADIRSFDLTAATGATDMVVLCYTLQFLPVADRLPLLCRLCDTLRPGGGLILAEKVRRRDPEQEARLRRVHHAFKRSQGYTQAEIDAKDRSLEGILVPLHEDENTDLLAQAGFAPVHTIFENTCFKAWLAVRP
ncbi:methyltransferase domain-containing protein [Natronospirillum operosum]|uniref:Methyltransferase domain-containing protein n=1 Tax=Natronospirillum operosum TaxID=2759953 RepID=A0A4Z0WB40_9GAMM|nr:methyltransferase domain-containing protein [Natronospirillum operosum]TGG91286.1 methyltransferase domain-containing protein [Natronospirillum operosum]